MQCGEEKKKELPQQNSEEQKFPSNVLNTEMWGLNHLQKFQGPKTKEILQKSLEIERNNTSNLSRRKSLTTESIEQTLENCTTSTEDKKMSKEDSDYIRDSTETTSSGGSSSTSSYVAGKVRRVHRTVRSKNLGEVRRNPVRMKKKNPDKDFLRPRQRLLSAKQKGSLGDLEFKKRVRSSTMPYMNTRSVTRKMYNVGATYQAPTIRDETEWKEWPVHGMHERPVFHPQVGLAAEYLGKYFTSIDGFSYRELVNQPEIEVVSVDPHSEFLTPSSDRKGNRKKKSNYNKKGKSSSQECQKESKRFDVCMHGSFHCVLGYCSQVMSPIMRSQVEGKNSLIENANYNLMGEEKHKLIEEEKYSLLGDGKYNLAAESKHNLPAEGKHNLAVESKHNLAVESKHNLAVESKDNLAVEGKHNQEKENADSNLNKGIWKTSSDFSSFEVKQTFLKKKSDLERDPGENKSRNICNVVSGSEQSLKSLPRLFPMQTMYVSNSQKSISFTNVKSLQNGQMKVQEVLRQSTKNPFILVNTTEAKSSATLQGRILKSVPSNFNLVKVENSANDEGLMDALPVYKSTNSISAILSSEKAMNIQRPKQEMKKVTEFDLVKYRLSQNDERENKFNCSDSNYGHSMKSSIASYAGSSTWPTTDASDIAKILSDYNKSTLRKTESQTARKSVSQLYQVDGMQLQRSKNQKQNLSIQFPQGKWRRFHFTVEKLKSSKTIDNNNSDMQSETYKNHLECGNLKKNNLEGNKSEGSCMANRIIPEKEIVLRVEEREEKLAKVSGDTGNSGESNLKNMKFEDFVKVQPLQELLENTAVLYCAATGVHQEDLADYIDTLDTKQSVQWLEDWSNCTT